MIQTLTVVCVPQFQQMLSGEWPTMASTSQQRVRTLLLSCSLCCTCKSLKAADNWAKSRLIQRTSVADCYGGDRQVELEDFYSERRTPYSLTGPSVQCNAEGWLLSCLRTSSML